MIAEFVGGPKDGEEQVYSFPPQRVTVVAKPEGYFAALTQPGELMAHTMSGLLEGDYQPITLPQDLFQNPTARGFYYWQGYR